MTNQKYDLSRRSFISKTALALSSMPLFASACYDSEKVLSIVKFPDYRLRKVSSEITNIDDVVLDLQDSLVETMRYNLSLGLSAPQVGINLRMITCRFRFNGEESGIYSMINPVITKREGEYKSLEGCISVRGHRKRIERSRMVTASYLDGSGVERSITVKNKNAALLQHEIDHLDGRLITDY
jgi:peptide deformylase